MAELVNTHNILSWSDELHELDEERILSFVEKVNEDASDPLYDCDESLNSHIHFTTESPLCLEVDTVVCPVNEVLDVDSSSLFTEVCGRVGYPIRQEITEAYSHKTFSKNKVILTSQAVYWPRTGDIDHLSSLIFSCDPKYYERFKVAAASSLMFCYHNALKVLLEEEEEKAKTEGLKVAIVPLYTASKKYPRNKGAIIALNTVRSFLKKLQSTEYKMDIYFCFPEEHCEASDYDHHIDLAHVFFPKPSTTSEVLLRLYPDSIKGNNNEREIPVSSMRRTCRLNAAELSNTTHTEIRETTQYGIAFSWLRKIRELESELSEFAQTEAIVRKGKFIHIVTSRITNSEIAWLYLYKTIEEFQQEYYLVVYYQNGSDPDFWSNFDELPESYNDMLKNILLIAPSWWTKVKFGFRSSIITDKLKIYNDLNSLGDFKQQLYIPDTF
ncbi:hypothetical protein PCE1_003568 [Barthelona sp. PCE]